MDKELIRLVTIQNINVQVEQSGETTSGEKGLKTIQAY